jgi:hypothetical protein
MKPVVAALAAALALAPLTAHAGPYTDALGKCVSKSATAADQVVLVTWLFGAISAHPAFEDYSKVTPAQREELNKKAALLIQRLLTEDCRQQTVDAVKHEGTDSIGTSFGVLGEVAMESMMSEPKVQANFTGLEKYLDASKFEDMGKAAATSK